MILAPDPPLTVPPPRDLFFHRKSHIRRNLFLTLFGLLFVLCLFTRWPRYAGTAVCQECGSRRDFFAWDTRFASYTLGKFSTDHATSLSQIFSKQKLLNHHRHRFTSPVASFDESAPNLLLVVDAPRVTRFAEGLSLYETPAVLTKWRLIMLDPQYSLVMDGALHFLRFPEAGFSDPATFRAWWVKAEFPLWNRLRELTEPD